MASTAWLWMYAGAALMLLELMAPGFVIFFFGLSAASVGLLKFALGPAFTPVWQAIAFSVFSILYLACLRRWLKSIFTGGKSEEGEDFDDGFAGRIGKTTADILPPQSGRVLLGDAEWDAVASSPLKAGTEVKVKSRKNLTLEVEAL